MDENQQQDQRNAAEELDVGDGAPAQRAPARPFGAADGDGESEADCHGQDGEDEAEEEPTGPLA